MKTARRRWRLWLGATMGLVVALAALSYLKRAAVDSDAQRVGDIARDAANSDRVDAAGGLRESARLATSPTSLSSLEQSSLRGTETDGGVVFGADGEVSVDLGLRRLFDYYLSLIGERDLAQIRQLLEAHMSSRYGAANVASVMPYFDRYTDYLAALSKSNIAASTDPQARLDHVKALRRRVLGQTMATAFFGEEEALASLTLKRIAIASDRTLSVDERSRRLAELDASSAYAARADAGTASTVAEQERRFDTMNLTDRQRAREREALWGKDAAVRLEQLDRDTAQWDARVERYLAARARIDANAGMSSAARAQAVATLRAQQFNPTEQRRIVSLEAIGQLKPGG